MDPEAREPVLVAGAGALGSVVGALLARHGWPVTLLGRAAHLEAVASHGLFVHGLFGEHHVTGIPVVTRPDQLVGSFAAILVTVKSWDTRSMIEAVGPRLAPAGWVVSLQNGLGNLETVADVVGPGRVLGARVIFGAEIPEPGHVRVTVIADPVLVGAFRATDTAAVAAARRWAARLDAAGIPAAYTPDVGGDLWGKVLYNAALNPLGAMLGVPYGYLATQTDTTAIMDAVIDEAFAVADAAGVRLPWASAVDYRRLFYERLVPATAEHRSSMLQDLERGRPTEIDAINGWIVALGERLGIATPANAILTRLIRARVRRAREQA